MWCRTSRIDYLPTLMPGSTFRRIHESSVTSNRKNTKLELISVVHEEISAGVAHGYSKIAGKPMAILVHNTVGLQHASMAVYNAWCDRAPMLILTGNIMDAANRRPGVEWDHTATDVSADRSRVPSSTTTRRNLARAILFRESDDACVSADDDPAVRSGAGRRRRRLGGASRSERTPDPDRFPLPPVHIAAADPQTLDQDREDARRCADTRSSRSAAPHARPQRCRMLVATRGVAAGAGDRRLLAHEFPDQPLPQCIVQHVPSSVKPTSFFNSKVGDLFGVDARRAGPYRA